MMKNYVTGIMVTGYVFLMTIGLWADYQPEWSSLEKHYQTPEWFRDAKFGIYTHWGPVTVGAETVGGDGVQWYGRYMYMKSNKLFNHHKEHYGDQNEFGYKDLSKLFNPKHFDAKEWAELFAASGARFAGPVAIHHDNYAMWHSKVNPWNSYDQSPKRDFTGELEKAIKAQGLKFITTFHHSFTWEYFRPSYGYDGADGKNVELYGEVHKENDPPSKRFLTAWLGMVNEVVHRYEPDLIWFDFGLGKIIPEKWQQRMFADYYNWAAAKGKQVGVAHKHWEIHKHTGIIDFERGRLNKATPFAWLTDTSVGPWFHEQNANYKNVNQLVDVLIDIVSKNGCLLLNVDPTMDGRIPEKSKALLLGLGKWLKVNGEAIYGTRPMAVFGEGPTRMDNSGGFSEKKEVSYTGHDIRFTQSKDGRSCYAIVMAKPGSSLSIQSYRFMAHASAKVELLGSDEKVSWNLDDQGHLTIAVEESQLREQPAYVYKITGFERKLVQQKLDLDKPIKLAFISCARDARFFDPVKKGMNDAAKMLGVQCDFLGTPGVDVKAQERLVNKAVEDGYDGLAVNIIDPEAFDRIIEQAIAVGVPVVGFNVDDADTPNARLSSVNQRLYDSGKTLGQRLLDRIKPGSRVLLTMHDEGVSALKDRMRGIQEVLKTRGITWITAVTGNDSKAGAQVVAKLLKAHPDIHVVIGTGQSDTEAAGRAIEAEFSAADYWAAGFDLSEKTLELIRGGQIYCTVDQQPYVQGFYPVVQLVLKIRYGLMPSDIDAGATIIDRSNVDQVEQLTKMNYR